MTKRPSLFAAKLEVAADQTPAPTTNGNSAAMPAGNKRPRPPSRAGKRVLSVYLDPIAWKQLRLLALDTNTSAQALGEEAINLLFEKHKLNRSA